MARIALLALAAAAAFAPAALAQPAPSPPVTLDGPDAAIVSLNGLSVARDGTGGLVYLKAIGGVPHVVVSTLTGGQFQPPQQVDGGLAGASSQPVIAAGNGGLLLIAFINAGGLYVVGRTSPAASFSTPAPLAGGAINPSLQMTNFGKAYLAFTVADGSGHDVRSAYYASGTWALEGPPLNAVPADDAGTGAGGPQVAAAGDGVAIVAWGEGGHVFTRRVWGTAPSVVDEQADPPSVSGCGEVAPAAPATPSESPSIGIASGGDSSYADVAFQETVSCGGLQQTRVLVNRLHASQYDGAVSADGLSSPGTESAADPQVAMTEYGQGFATAALQVSHNVVAMDLGNNGAYGPVQQLGSLANTAPPYPVAGIAGLFSAVVAWQQTPGSTGPADIRVRYQPRAEALAPEQVVSSPTQGPTDAARGLAVAGDVGGDAAIAWVQGSGASTQIVVERLYQTPGAPASPTSVTYARSAQPVLSWLPSGARWGPITYSVRLDGVQIGQTGASAIRVPSPLSDGGHTWLVTATNPAGLSGTSRVATVFVDTVAPRVTVRLSGARLAGAPLALRVTDRDRPPAGLPARAASGVATVTIRWGDGKVTRLRRGDHRLVHSYRRAGRYTITVIVADRAGNRKKVVRHVKIKKASAAGSPAGKR